nr:RNA-directed DNA polymerase, eukaryota [Tanacetum cinerariifolium]
MGLDGRWFRGNSVASARMIIDKGTLINDGPPTRWRKEVLIKVNIFIWRMVIDKLPTWANLSHRGIEVQSITCGTCEHGFESINHVMLECPVAMDMWRLVERWWKFDIPTWNSIGDVNIWIDNLAIPSRILVALWVGVLALPKLLSLGSFLLELRLKREAAERAFEAQAEKDRTLMRLEELRFLATSTKDLDDDTAYWIKKQKRLIKNKMRNDLGDEDGEDE